jgi:hypothetical protein
MKYMLAIIAPEGGMEDVSPEEMKAGLERWAAMDRTLIDAGAFIAGDGLHPTSTASTVRVGENGEKLVTDGPFAETKEQLGGFYLIECENLDQALEWAHKVPLQGPGAVEVRPVMDFAEYGYESSTPSAKVAL